MKNVFILLSCLFLAGCSFETFGETPENASCSNAYDLEEGRVYIWEGTSEDDLMQTRKGEDIFFLCPGGDTNFKKSDQISAFTRCIYMDEENYERVPTYTEGTSLIYVSGKEVFEDITFERFADCGYSIGISNLKGDAGGHFYITYMDTAEDDYRFSLDLKSDAVELTGFEDISRLYLDKVGDTYVTEKNVSPAGSVEGLEKDERYVCEFYTGSFYQDFLLTANIRIFGSLETFTLHDYEFMHANCIRIRIPEWLKSGYYYVNGCGLFRYISDKDMALWEAGKKIDFNDPIKEYDPYGVCIYDPSIGLDRREGY